MRHKPTSMARGPTMWMCVVVCVMLVHSNGVEASWWNELLPSFSAAPSCSSTDEFCLPSGNFGLSNVNGYVAAYGDFNSDSFTDLFLISGDPSTQKLAVYTFYSSDFTYKFEGDAVINEPNILNVAPGDFNYDGRLDVLVTGDRNGQLYMHLYYGDLKSFRFGGDIVAQTGQAPLDQVLVLDANNDQAPDLFGISATTGARLFWINPKTSGNWTTKAAPTDVNSFPVAIPNSNAFVDLNGDCISDLVVITENPTTHIKSLELWVNQKTNGFSLAQTYSLPPGAGQLAFADLNGDGSIDVYFPVCLPAETCEQESSIHIIYNTQPILCASLWSTNCVQPGSMCSSTDFSFPNMNATTQSQKVVIMSLLDAGYKFSNDLLLPVTLRSGDYNLDGYPDVLVPVQNGSSVALSLWQNVPCSDTLCASDATSAGARTFQVVTKGVGALSSIKPYAGSFIDIGEQGILDILISAEDSTIKGLWNSFVNDAYFLKALGSNGICPGWCSTSPKFPNPKPYGVNFPGGMFKWTVTNTKGSRRGAIGVQLSQSAYMALQTPYVFMGLGRTSNYIDTMFYGISSNQAVHTNSWSGIIPNSQVAAFPYKIEKPATWTMEMYISPSGILFWVIVACVLACLILASLIGYLTYREHVQDKQEEQEKGFAFNKL